MGWDDTDCEDCNVCVVGGDDHFYSAGGDGCGNVCGGVICVWGVLVRGGDALGVMHIRGKVGGDIGNGVSNKCSDCSGSYGAVSGEGYRDHVAGEVRGCVADKGCREGNVGHGIMRGN